MPSASLAVLLSAVGALGAGACRIRYETADGLRVIDGVRQGELLRTALLRRGVSPHNGNSKLINCRGLGTCGTCAVWLGNASDVSPKKTKETLRLGLPPHGPESAKRRLACQCTVLGDVYIKKYDGFWGQDTESLAPASQCKTYFGELEYILDTSSPSPEPCSVCQGTEWVDCPRCSAKGYLDLGTLSERQCTSCKGSGQVVCRSCFSGDPFDVEAVRERARRRPD